jgi:hypothetical protein
MKAREAWDRFWFAPDVAFNLAVARIAAAGTALWILLSRNLGDISGLGTAFWHEVPATARWRFLLFPGHAGTEHVLTLIALAALVGALLGIVPRWCCLVAGLLLYHLAPLESIIWSTSPMARGLTLPTLALLVCAAGPSGDALALRAGAPTQRSWLYGWPLRLIQVFLVESYFFAAMSKVRLNGLSWGSPQNLSNWIRIFTQSPGHAVYHQIGGWIASRPLLAGAVGYGTLLFEFSMVVALFSKRLRPWFATGAILFHAGIYFTMNITFNSWPLLLAFYDWDRLLTARRLGGWSGAGSTNSENALTVGASL